MKRNKKRYRKAVFVVVYRKKNNKLFYLILKRKLHWKGWEFPKGGIEKNESKITAVIRETREETGLKPIKIKKLSMHGKYQYNKKAMKDRKGFCGQNFSLYAAEVNKKKIKLDKIEHSGHKWLVFEKALKILTWPNQRKALRLANKRI